jgi:hypothetical protein
MRARIVAQLVLAALAVGCGNLTTVEYTSPEGRYRARFPGEPKIQDQMFPTPVGPVPTKIAMSVDWSGSARMVMYADYPAAMVHAGNQDAVLEGFCQGWAPGAQVTIVTKVPVSVQGHPGREINFESLAGSKAGKAKGRTRVFLVGHRLYQVLIAGPPGRMTPDAMAGFLDSFVLLDQPAQPAGPNLAGSPPPVAALPGPGLRGRGRRLHPRHPASPDGPLRAEVIQPPPWVQ